MYLRTGSRWSRRSSLVSPGISKLASPWSVRTTRWPGCSRRRRRQPRGSGTSSARMSSQPSRPRIVSEPRITSRPCSENSSWMSDSAGARFAIPPRWTAASRSGSDSSEAGVAPLSCGIEPCSAVVGLRLRPRLRRARRRGRRTGLRGGRLRGLVGSSALGLVGLRRRLASWVSCGSARGLWLGSGSPAARGRARGPPAARERARTRLRAPPGARASARAPATLARLWLLRDLGALLRRLRLAVLFVPVRLGPRAKPSEALLVGGSADHHLGALDRRMTQCFAETDPKLLGRHRGERAAPLQTVGPIGGALDHLLELVGVELEHVGVCGRRLLERRAQPCHQLLAAAGSDPLGGLLGAVVHRPPSSRRDLMCARNRAAWAPIQDPVVACECQCHEVAWHDISGSDDSDLTDLARGERRCVSGGHDRGRAGHAIAAQIGQSEGGA